MKRVLIGHRGVGKTSLLWRHLDYFPKVKHFDLDHEIEKSTGILVSEYFEKFGEINFRKKELEMLYKIVDENSDFVISLGAGFDSAALPEEIDVIFVSRVTDADGRIFLDRPRLKLELTPVEESQLLFKARERNYIMASNLIYHMPEGLETVNEIENIILSEAFEVKDAYYTLKIQDLPRITSLMRCYEKIELRTDLLNSVGIQYLLNEHPEQHWLVSVRTENSPLFSNAKYVDVDYKYYFKGCQIVSSHADEIAGGLKELFEFNARPDINEKVHLKLSPIIENFSDLIIGYNWQQQDAANRSFLPRSKNGKWAWYRKLCKYNQKINFVRNHTDMADQPSLFEWLILPNIKPQKWAGIIGKPVHFSRSLTRHLNYFLQLQSFFTKIEIETEDFKKYFGFLTDLGLQYVAITSPLKEAAFQIAVEPTKMAQQLRAANSLYIKEKHIFCHNTDWGGFNELVENIKSKDKIAVWGGGGTLAMIKNILPTAHYYSSQTGQLRDKDILAFASYDYLIWAAPRTELAKWPPLNMQVISVIDLNYTDDSMGLEFATQRKIKYVSGAKMFNAQALLQQEFWSSKN